jgi:hypothetical protein
MRRAIKAALNNLGYDLTRWDRFPFERQLKNVEIDLIFDVGANIGQYARLLWGRVIPEG